MSQHPDNKEAFCRLIQEAFNNGDMNAVDELVAPEFVDHELFGADIPPNRDGLKAGIRMCRSDIPDLTVTVDNVAEEEEGKVVARTTWRGNLKAAPGSGGDTGNPVEIRTCDVARFEAGRMKEHWGLADNETPGWPLAVYLPMRRAAAEY